MTRWLARCFALFLLVLPFVPAVADYPDGKDIERLVKQLGSSDFRTREAARKELEAIGEPARAALRKVVASNADLETKRRAALPPTAKEVTIQVPWSLSKSVTGCSAFTCPLALSHCWYPAVCFHFS